MDTLDDRVERAYSGWPDRIYVVDGAGRIAYKGGPGPRGFSVPEADEALKKLLAETPPAEGAGTAVVGAAVGAGVSGAGG